MKNIEDEFKNDKFFQDPDKYFKNVKIKMIIAMIILTVLASVLFILFGNKIDEQVAATKSFLGKKVVIEKDTLTVINYSTFMRTYKLSNGVDYDMDFVKAKVVNSK